MALTNKDGTPYKLRHPNKLAKDQVMWDFEREKFILHNCKWSNTETKEDNTVLVPRQTDFKVMPPQKAEVTIISRGEEEKIEESIKPPKPVSPVEEKPAPVEQPKTEPVETKTRARLMPELEQPPEALEALEEFVPKKHEDVEAKHIIIFHCLPALITDRTDDLYGEQYRTIKRGEKFSFEGVLVELDDLKMSFWTNVQIGEGSIVFPSKDRRGRSVGQYRWWKIQQNEEHMGGYLHHCIFSDVQPDFSD